MTRIWDPLLRLFHWSLVISFAVAWVTAEDMKGLHEWAGYAAAALIGFRLFWGVIGPRYARFSQFVKGPKAVTSYLKSMRDGNEKRYLGHNPAGGAMVLAMLATLLIVTATGWMQTLPQYTNVGWVRGGHDALSSLLMFMVVVHVVGVLLASKRHNENLARAMVTGDKSTAKSGDIT